MTLESTIDFNDILEDIYTENNATVNAHDSTYIDDIQQIKQNENYLHKYNILHINIQSLPAKYDKLKELIASFYKEGIALDFILLCETFLTDNNMNLFQIT